MPSKKKKLSKTDFVTYLRQLYESRDVYEKDIDSFAWIIETVSENKTGKISVRTLKNYKAENGWKKGQLASGPLVAVIRREEIARPHTKTKGPKIPNVNIEISPPEIGSEKHREFQKWSGVGIEEKRSIVRDIGERYFETGALPYKICKDHNLPYGVFVRWTTEVRELEIIWKMYREQRTMVICEALKGYMINVADRYIEKAFQEKITINKKWITTGIDNLGELVGVWVNDTMKIEPPEIPKPSDMAALLQIVQAQERAAKATTEPGDETAGADLDEALRIKEGELSKLKTRTNEPD